MPDARMREIMVVAEVCSSGTFKRNGRMLVHSASFDHIRAHSFIR